MKSLKTTWNHIRRSPYQAFAAILVMMQTFFLISVFSFIIGGSTSIIQYFESIPQVSAFFRDEAKPEEINALKEQLKATGKVSSIKYVSKQNALRIYQSQFKEDPLLLELVTADILPASIDVRTHNINDLTGVSEILRGSQIVSNVALPKDVVSNLVEVTNALRKTGLGIIAVLVMVSTFVMAIIIGFKISQKREEIEIMRLLSATNWYIRWPFLFEGIFYGIVGAFFGWLFSTAALIYFGPMFKSLSVFKSITLLPETPLFIFGLLGVELAVAVVLGIFASFLVVLRYLK
ncbi:MAG: ABC transporter permease [Candidatus Levybacteria bacterium]|nr:ABC transporter permease [Candidatus Levybacteria bacterium]